MSMLMLTANRNWNQNEEKRERKWRHSTELTSFPAYKEDRRVWNHFQIDNYYLVSVHASIRIFIEWSQIVVNVKIGSDINRKNNAIANRWSMIIIIIWETENDRNIQLTFAGKKDLSHNICKHIVFERASSSRENKNETWRTWKSKMNTWTAFTIMERLFILFPSVRNVIGASRQCDYRKVCMLDQIQLTDWNTWRRKNKTDSYQQQWESEKN